MTDRMTVKIDQGEIGDLIKKLQAESKKVNRCALTVINKYALKIQASARINLEGDPRRIDDGILRASIQALVNRLAAMVFTVNEYADFVHWGTGIHGQNPEGKHRKTPWVYFDQKRKQFFVTSGMEPNKFLLDAFNEHKEDLLRDLKKCLKG